MATQQHTSYPVFRPNQLLTNGQLNALRDYLEEQNQLTRTALIGIGIVCGFELSVENRSGAARVLRIGQGVGITSVGHLFTSGPCVLNRVMPYDADAFGGYRPFQTEGETEEQDVNLLELISEDFEANEEDEADGLRTLRQADLSNAVVLLYLEQYDRNLKSCLSKGCDETGTERRLNLRRLLMSREDARRVLERTGNQDMRTFPARFALGDMTLRRPDFGDPFDRFESVERLGLPFREAIQTDSETEITRIIELWTAGWRAFLPVLRGIYPDNPFESRRTRLMQISEAFRSNQDFGVQYLYDFLQDLVLTWKEFRAVSLRLMTACLPNRELFPRHLFLGAPVSGCVPSEWRQPFIQTPVYSSQKDLLGETRMLFTRAIRIIDQFDQGVMEPGSFRPKVTPSPVQDNRLSHTPVPFYYRNSEEDHPNGSLIANWTYEDVKRCLGGASVLSYARNDEGAGAGNEITHPLAYNRSGFGFYRIEGALGHPCEEVLTEIRRLVRRYNLPFDVQAVRLSNDTPPLVIGIDEDGEYDSATDYGVSFHDLHEDYAALRAELAEWLSSGIDVLRLHNEIVDAEDQEDYFTRTYDGFLEGSPFGPQLRNMNRIREIADHLVTYLCQVLPDCVREFADRFGELQQGYADAITFVAEQFMNELVRSNDHMDLGTDDLENLRRNQRIVAKLNEIAHQVLEMFFYNRMYRIYYAWRRREYFTGVGRAGAHRTLASFLEAHPGIEHRAGTTEGGTFVLVYGEHADHEQRVLADFMLPYRCCGGEIAIPVCDDVHAIAGIRVRPYARPVFTMTRRDEPLSINLLRFVRDIHRSDASHCDQNDAAELRIREVTPFQSPALPPESLSPDGIVVIRPPRGFTGILRYTYTAEKGANGLTDTGTILIAVMAGCMHLTDFSAELDLYGSVTFNLPTEFGNFSFDSFDYDPENSPVYVLNNGYMVTVELIRDIDAPFRFNYTATDGYQIGCGSITITPRRSFRVSGIVTDASTPEFNNPIPFAVVAHSPSGQQVTTNRQGFYEISSLAALSGTLFFSAQGYHPRERNVNGNTVINVQLDPVQSDPPPTNPGLEVLSTQTMTQILLNRGINRPGDGDALIRNFVASVRQEPVTATELSRRNSVSEQTFGALNQAFGIGFGDFAAVAQIINALVQNETRDIPVRPDPDVPIAGNPIRTINSGDLTPHAGDLTVPEIQSVLRSRDIDFSTGENKSELLGRLLPALETTPLQGEEIDALSDTTLNRLRTDVLGDQANAVTNEGFRNLLINPSR